MIQGNVIGVNGHRLRVLAEAALPKSGGTMEGTLDMGGNKIINVATPTDDNDVVSKKFLDDALDDALSEQLSMDLLWENASPSSNFASQTVTVDCSDYRSVRIQFSTTPGASSRSWWDIPVGSNGICITGFYPSTGFTVVTRIATVSETAINFGKDIGKIYASSETIINGTAEYMIPLKIYGIK